MLIIFNFFLLLTTTLQNCSFGCLKCSPQNTCQLCDQLNGYYLQNYTCQNSLDDNCMLIDENGLCLFCQAGHYIDPNTSKCIAVDINTIINNCSHYSSLGSCIKCDHGFYLFKGTCELPERQITNCYRYQSIDSCAECISGFYLSSDHQHCLKNQIQNCAIGSYHVCQGCTQKYILNENKIVMDQFNDHNVFDITKVNWSLIEIATKDMLHTYLVNQCDILSNDNCKVQLDSQHCSQCDDGYFLDNFKCYKNPSPKITYCEVYKNRNECQNCKQGYYMQEQNKCIEINTILNCAYYESDLQQKSTCKQCKQNYYLTDNFCMKSDIIDNCQVYSLHSNTCSLCSQFYTTSFTKKTCIQKIPNCDVHAFNQLGDLICYKCFNKKYYNSNKGICEDGTVQNCISYIDSTECQECINGYYLNDNKCLAQLQIENCEEHDPIQFNACLKCNAKSAKVFHNIGCEKIIRPIQFCEEYNDQLSCKKCQEGYYLTLHKECQLISLILNCKQYRIGDGCLQCKENHILQNGQCYPPSKLQIQNCIKSELTGDQTFQQAQCLVCNQYSFPFNIKDYMFCMETSLVDSYQQDNIDNCIKYMLTNQQTLICLQCKQNYLLQNDKCIPEEDCQDTIIPYTIQDDKIYQQNICMNFQNGCLKAIPNQKIQTQYICIKCNQNTHVQVLQQWQTLQYDYVSFKDFTLYQDNLSKSPVSYHPRIECSSKSDNFVNDQIIDNCEYYTLLTNTSTLGCVKCINGYTGSINTQNTISQCIQMVTCQQGELEGVPQHINKLMSCHKCQNINEIPFVLIKAESIYEYAKSLTPYDNDTFIIQSSGGLNIRCMKPDALDLKMSLGFAFPRNCAMGYYNLDSIKDASHSDQTQNIDRNKIAVFCVSCKPSFKAISGADSSGTIVQDYIGECKSIENCYYSDWLNYCSKCNENFIWEYTDDNGILYDSCIFYNHDKNCLAAKRNVSNNYNNCMVCKKGYFLNKDSYCEKIQIQQCDGFNDGLLFSKQNYSIINYQYFQIQGCSECDDDSHQMIMETQDFPVCVSTEYFLNQNFYKLYIKNCQNYETNLQSIKCYKCINGFTINMSGTECLNVELQNCVKLKDTSKCGQCLSNYVLINGQCQLQNLQHCSIYDMDIDSEIQICTQCEEGYYWNGTQCVIGKVLKCKKYQTNDSNCVECLMGYTLGSDKNGNKFCLKNDDDMKCLKYDNIVQGVANCIQCNKDYILSTQNTNFREVSCLEVSAFIHCLQYNMEQSISHSDLQCLQCDQDYFLDDNNICIQRQQNIQGCIEYQTQNNLCQLCKDGMFVNEDGQCETNPSGIQNCVKYFNELQCEQCIAPYYLNNNFECDEVIVTIQNCLFYDINQQCIQCEDGYYFDQICQQITIPNCTVSKDDKVCQKCQHNYYPINKITSDLNDQCTLLKPTSFCSQYSQGFSYHCSKCISGYYLDVDFKCKAVEVFIKNCDEYKDQHTCKKCNENTVLARDSKSCLEGEIYQQLFDSQCKFRKLSEQLVCKFCQQGYYLQEGYCTECQKENCGFCDSFHSEHCLVCKIGYYMDEDNNCHKNNINKNEGDKKIEFVKYQKILGYLISWILLIIQFDQINQRVKSATGFNLFMDTYLLRWQFQKFTKIKKVAKIDKLILKIYFNIFSFFFNFFNSISVSLNPKYSYQLYSYIFYFNFNNTNTKSILLTVIVFIIFILFTIQFFIFVNKPIILENKLQKPYALHSMVLVNQAKELTIKLADSSARKDQNKNPFQSIPAILIPKPYIPIPPNPIPPQPPIPYIPPPQLFIVLQLLSLPIIGSYYIQSL